MSHAALPRLYHRALSHYCEKARMLLCFKRIRHELVYVPFHDPRALLRASGQDYIPYLEPGGGGPGRDWRAIADWAEEAVPEPTLYPGGTLGLCRVVEDWAHGVVEEAVWKVVLPDAPSCFVDEQERWVFTEMQERKRGPLEVVAMRRRELEADLARACAPAEEALRERPWLVADAPSLADFALYGALQPLHVTGRAIPEAFPLLRAWRGRLERAVDPSCSIQAGPSGIRALDARPV